MSSSLIIRVGLLLVGIPLLAHGGEGLYHAFMSRHQAQLSCAEFVRDRPRSSWLRLNGCEVDYVRAGYRESQGRITELFFPVRPSGASPAQPAAVVISTSEPRILSIAENALNAGASSDPEAYLVMMLQIVTAMGVSREIQGMSRSRLEMLRTRAALGAIKAPLAGGFAILDLHEIPRMLFPAIETVAGAQALLVSVFLGAARRRGRAAAQLSLGAADTAPFRRLMLLNLPPHSPLQAIEGAPPLGPQPAVRAALGRVLPGMTFHDDGTGEFSRPDHSIRVDLGKNPDVWTAVLDVTGEGAAAALHRLITQTGWQAYAPKRGRFIQAEDLEP